MHIKLVDFNSERAILLVDGIKVVVNNEECRAVCLLKECNGFQSKEQELALDNHANHPFAQYFVEKFQDNNGWHEERNYMFNYESEDVTDQNSWSVTEKELIQGWEMPKLP